MADDSRLAISVTHADGRVTKWSANEVDGGNIPSDLTFTTTVPGGFGAMSCSLLREIEPRSDEALYDDVRVYGAGNQTVWQGRMAQLPRQGGRSSSVTPGAVGHSAHLEDDPSFRQVIVDRDPASWQAAPLERQVAIAVGGFGQGKVPASAASGGLSWQVPNEALPANEHSELWYEMPAGRNVASFAYIGNRTGTWTSLETETLFVPTDRTGASGTSVSLSLTNSIQVTSSFTPARYAMLRTRTTGSVTPPIGTTQTYSVVAVYGDHGITLRSVFAEPYHVYASDVLAYILDEAAPLLNYTTGSAGTIQPTTFAIPHLVFKDPTTAADAISQVNAYHAWDWAVWEDKTFYYTQPGTGVEWQARIGDGAQLSLEGDSAEQIINGVVVSYADGGVSKLAGPPGSGCDVEDSALGDTASDNPVNSHGIPRRWQMLPISFPTTDAGAVELGAIYLAQTNLASRKGTVTLRGHVRHPTEGMVPVWRVRAGDSVVITDRAGDTARRIISTNYSHNGREITLDCGTTPNKLDALLQRLTVGTSTLMF